MAAPPRESRIPRWLVSASWPVSGVLLTLFFVFLGFPYDLLALRLSDQALQSMNLRLSIGDLSPHVGPLGLGLVATDVLAAQEGGNTIAVDALILRPAWSLFSRTRELRAHPEVAPWTDDRAPVELLTDRAYRSLRPKNAEL